MTKTFCGQLFMLKSCWLRGVSTPIVVTMILWAHHVPVSALQPDPIKCSCPIPMLGSYIDRVRLSQPLSIWLFRSHKRLTPFQPFGRGQSRAKFSFCPAATIWPKTVAAAKFFLQNRQTAKRDSKVLVKNYRQIYSEELWILNASESCKNELNWFLETHWVKLARLANQLQELWQMKLYHNDFNFSIL